MKNPVQNNGLVLMLAGAMVLASGCTTGLTTSLVWRIKEYHPAEEPHLNLATCAQKDDVLVQYNECFGKSLKPQPRAYWLLEYAAKDTNSLARPSPKFINPATCTNLLAVPQPSAAVEPTKGFCAVPDPDQHAFMLWRNGKELGCYSLPVYSNAPPVTFWRVALTPVTVVTDTAIVLGVATGH